MTKDRPSGDHRVVIVGAGFGGMAAARALRDARCRVTLIDRTNHTLFQPLLYQVATAALSSTTIAVPVRSVFRRNRNVSVLMAQVIGIDRQTRSVRLEGGDAIPFDSLVIATGSVYSWFGHDDWAARAPALKTAADALLLRNQLLSAFERAEAAADPDAVRRLLTFVVVGAGPTGVELAGSLGERARGPPGRGGIRPPSSGPDRAPRWRAPRGRATSAASIPGRRGSSCATPDRGCCPASRSRCRITPRAGCSNWASS